MPEGRAALCWQRGQSLRCPGTEGASGLAGQSISQPEAGVGPTGEPQLCSSVLMSAMECEGKLRHTEVYFEEPRLCPRRGCPSALGQPRHASTGGQQLVKSELCPARSPAPALCSGVWMPSPQQHHPFTPSARAPPEAPKVPEPCAMCARGSVPWGSWLGICWDG